MPPQATEPPEQVTPSLRASLESTNLADTIDEEKLVEIGRDAREGYEVTATKRIATMNLIIFLTFCLGRWGGIFHETFVRINLHNYFDNFECNTNQLIFQRVPGNEEWSSVILYHP